MSSITYIGLDVHTTNYTICSFNGYAVAALQAGDDVKTVQGNLGHATAAFTLDVYGHVTDQMKEERANRMERFIHSVRTA